MVNWVTYHSIHGRGMGDNGSYDDEDDEGNGESLVEVADNYMRAPRNAMRSRRGNIVQLKSEEELRESYSKMDKEKIEASILGIDASVTAWLN